MLRALLGLIAIGLVIFIILVLTGVVSLTTEGEFRIPDVNVSATGGEVPSIDVDAKEVVIGTTQKQVEVPSMGTENATVEVPTVEVRDQKKN